MVKGLPKIKVVFRLDADGILNVTATEELNQIEQHVVISADSTRLSEEEIQRLVLAAKEAQEKDREMAKFLEKRKELLDEIGELWRMTEDQSQLTTQNIENWLEIREKLLSIKGKVQTEIKMPTPTPSDWLTNSQRELQDLQPKIVKLYEVKNTIDNGIQPENDGANDPITMEELNQHLQKWLS